MCTLTGSALTQTSSVLVCDSFRVNVLLVSPDKKCITAGTKDNDDFSPKVCLVVFDSMTSFSSSCLFSCVFFYHITLVQHDVVSTMIHISMDSWCLVCWQVMYTESLTSPSEDEDPLCQSVPVAGCQAAVFIPTQPARLAVIHCTDRPHNKALSVFDVSIKKTKYKTAIQGED